MTSVLQRELLAFGQDNYVTSGVLVVRLSRVFAKLAHC